jgi:hypothetical protein
MGMEILLYKSFRVITINDSDNPIYQQIDPFSLRATSFNLTSGAVVEAELPIIHDAIGEYHCVMDESFYNEYDLFRVEWEVEYVDGSPKKKLFNTLNQFETPTTDCINE